MSNFGDTGLYEEDLYGTNPDNLIPAEVQTVSAPSDEDDFFFTIPHCAPFFATSLVVMNDATGVPYVLGEDYVIGHYFIEAMGKTGRPIAGSIRFLRQNINSKVRFRYQTLGGQWGFDKAKILAELSNRAINPVTRSWGMIAPLPATFPPLPHTEDVLDIVSAEEIVEGIDRLADVVEAAAEGTSASHINDKNNPHQVTAFQVNLGNLSNFKFATSVQATNPNFTDAYMNPWATGLLITSMALTPLNNHINDKNNPHGTTAVHVGLGSVPNYPAATASEAVNPTINNRLLTPYTASLLLAAQSDVGRIDALEQALNEHINDKTNPHEVTPEQLSVYTKAQVDAMLEDVSATDTPRFAGKTETEWRQSLPSFDDVTDIIDALGTNFQGGSAIVQSVVTQDPRDPAVEAAKLRALPFALEAGYSGYVWYDQDEKAVSYQSTDLKNLPATWTGTLRHAILPNAEYYVADDGSISNWGSASIAAPTGYKTGAGFVAANAAEQVFATKTAVYATLVDGRTIRWTSPASVQTLYTGGAVDKLFCNTEFKNAGEMVLIYMQNKTAVPYGGTSWITAMNAVLTAWGAALTQTLVDFYVSDVYVAAMFTDGTLKLYSITRAGGNVTLTAMALPTGVTANVVAISGLYDHVGIVNSDGTVVFLGTDVNGEKQVRAAQGPYKDVACGYQFTVTLDDQSRMFFWGDSPDNVLIPKNVR